ncbi:uncharacterized protein LOC134854541 [Symsagittifera roscoffensis]|uniref:uncharacterized protein LOC134854541 n=1 Tax=Symsagittifera roscoffensis TaxID=84072 RepID=UPI00307BF6A9
MGRRTKNANPSPIRKPNASLPDESREMGHSLEFVLPLQNQEIASTSNLQQIPHSLSLTQHVPKVTHTSERERLMLNTAHLTIANNIPSSRWPNKLEVCDANTTLTPTIVASSVPSATVGDQQLHYPFSYPVAIAEHTHLFDYSSNDVRKFLPSLSSATSQTPPEFASSSCNKSHQDNWQLNSSRGQVSATTSMVVSSQVLSHGFLTSHTVKPSMQKQPIKRRLDLSGGNGSRPFQPPLNKKWAKKLCADLNSHMDRAKTEVAAAGVIDSSGSEANAMSTTKMPPSVVNCSMRFLALPPSDCNSYNSSNISIRKRSLVSTVPLEQHKLCRVVSNSKAEEMRSMPSPVVNVSSQQPMGDLQQKNDGSLAQTSRRFVEYIQKFSGPPVDLNVMALKIKCPKRRLYDITNVLEGIGLLEKVSKNKVQWICCGGCDISFDHVNIASIKNELADLEKTEADLDLRVRALQDQYEKEIEDCINNRFGYVKHQAVRGVNELGANRLLIFANGPKNTEFSVYSSEKLAIRSHSGPIELFVASTAAHSKQMKQSNKQAPQIIENSCFEKELARRIEECSNSFPEGTGVCTRPSSSIGSLCRSACGSNRISPIDDVSRDSGLDSPSIAGSGLGGTRVATPVLPFTPTHSQAYVHREHTFQTLNADGKCLVLDEETFGFNPPSPQRIIRAAAEVANCSQPVSGIPFWDDSAHSTISSQFTISTNELSSSSSVQLESCPPRVRSKQPTMSVFVDDSIKTAAASMPLECSFLPIKSCAVEVTADQQSGPT